MPQLSLRLPAAAGVSLVSLIRVVRRIGDYRHLVRRLSLALACGLACAPSVQADTFTENFSTDPATNGWQAFGDATLFHWNATNHDLEVTWDSSHANSYFHHPLGTALTKESDFSVAFDLRLSDIAIGTDTNKPYTFQLAVGLINLGDATNAGFLRGTGFSSPNLVEFDYFPDSGYGATVDPAIISTNNGFSSGGFTFPLALVPGDLYHIQLIYTASTRTLATTMTSNGQPFGPVADATLSTSFSDFSVDQFSISSYSDAGQDPAYAGSLLAHGTVANIVIGTPPPVAVVAGAFSGTNWQAQFPSRSDWMYTLERTADLRTWSTVSPATAGNGGITTLGDTNAPGAGALYRVRAWKP